MLRKAFTLAVLAMAGYASLLATGCTSNEKPYGLTGNQTYGVNGAASTSPLSAQERGRYTDQKGRFHPEWVGSRIDSVMAMVDCISLVGLLIRCSKIITR